MLLSFCLPEVNFLSVLLPSLVQEYNPQGFQDPFALVAFPVFDCGENIDVSSLKSFP